MSTTEEINPNALHDLKGEKSVVDVRSPSEWTGGHIENAHHIPCGELSARVKELPEGPLVFVCAGGYRSILAASIVKKLGRDLVSHLPGGVLAWYGAGLPLVN